MARKANFQELADELATKFTGQGGKGNTNVARLLNSSKYKGTPLDRKLEDAVAASFTSPARRGANATLPAIQGGAAKRKLFQDLLKAHTDNGLPFADAFRKAIRGEKVKGAAKTAKSQKAKGATKAYGARQFAKMTPDQQDYIRQATADTGLGPIEYDKMGKEEFDRLLEDMDKVEVGAGRQPIFGKAADSPAPKKGDGPKPPDDPEDPVGGDGKKNTEGEDTEKKKPEPYFKPIAGIPHLRKIVGGTVVGGTLDRALRGRPAEVEQAQQQAAEELTSPGDSAMDRMIQRRMDRLEREGFYERPPEPQEGLPDVPQGMEVPQDDPMVFPEDNAVITQPTKKGAKR